MKRKAYLAALVMCMALAVNGCGNNKSEADSSDAQATEQEADTLSSKTDSEGNTRLVSVDSVEKYVTIADYKGITLDNTVQEVTDTDIDNRVAENLQNKSETVNDADAVIQNGDTATINFVGTKDGEAFEGGTANNYDLVIGSGTMIPGFEEGIVGMKKGETKDVTVTFPESYRSSDLAGQEVVFDVTVNSIEEKKEAVLDENFVQRMSDFTTVDEFKADTLADMEQEKETMAENQLEYDAFMAALDNSEFELNEEAVEQQYEAQMDYYTSMVQMYGMTMDDYVAAFGMTMDDFQKELRTAAENALKQELLVDAVAEEEKLEVTDEDRQKVADQYGTDIQNMKDTYGEEALDRTALVYKVQALVKDNAVVK